MSYILDALTKSQQERRQGGVPTLSTPQLTAGARRVAPARSVRGIVLLLATAGLLVGGYMFVRHAGEMDASRETTAGVRLAASRPDTPSAASREDRAPAPAVPSAPSPRPQIESTHAESTTSNQARGTPQQRPRAAGAGAAVASATRPAADPPSSAPFTEPAAPARVETMRLLDDLRSLAERPLPPTPSTAPRAATPRMVNAAQAPAARAPAAEEPEPVTRSPTTSAPVREGVGTIRDLPSGLKTGLGRLAINVHVYADEPDERMVIINMKRYREGDQLREGPRLDSITPTGAVLSYQSHRFLLDAR